MFMEIGKKITIEALARMMAKSFDHLEKRIDGVENSLRARMDEGFAEVNARLDKIEFIVTQNHENGISKLEDDLRMLKTKLA